MDIIIYTDGCCKGNPGPGGWGAVLICPDIPAKDDSGLYYTKEIMGGSMDTTNNEMELTACVEALSLLNGDVGEADIKVFTDSKYVKNGITDWVPKWKTNNWRTADKKPVAHKELWEQLDEFTAKYKIQFKWIRGHDGDNGNTRADQLANIGCESAKKKAVNA